jgi:hypothetical protein
MDAKDLLVHSPQVISNNTPRMYDIKLLRRRLQTDRLRPSLGRAGSRLAARGPGLGSAARQGGPGRRSRPGAGGRLGLVSGGAGIRRTGFSGGAEFGDEGDFGYYYLIIISINCETNHRGAETQRHRDAFGAILDSLRLAGPCGAAGQPRPASRRASSPWARARGLPPVGLELRGRHGGRSYRSL